MLSQTAEYALRSVLYVARHSVVEDADPVRVDDVATALDIPRNYLSKTMNVLATRGLLTSTRGPRGGYRLADPPASVPLARVVEVFDSTVERDGCLLRSGPCEEGSPCAAHDRWRAVHRSIRSFFDETTLADLMGEASAGADATPPTPRSEP